MTWNGGLWAVRRNRGATSRTAGGQRMRGTCRLETVWSARARRHGTRAAQRVACLCLSICLSNGYGRVRIGAVRERGTRYRLRCPLGSSLLSPDSVGLVVGPAGREVWLAEGRGKRSTWRIEQLNGPWMTPWRAFRRRAAGRCVLWDTSRHHHRRRSLHTHSEVGSQQTASPLGRGYR